MSLYRAANRMMTFKRQTAYVIDSVTATATLTIDRQPVSASLIEIEISGGTTNSGTVSVTGTVYDGALPSIKTEAITFTGARIKNTTEQFSSLSSITTTGLADEATVPTIAVRAIGVDGNPSLIPYTVAASRPVTAAYMQMRGAANWDANTYGTQETDYLQIIVSYETAWTPRVGDLIYDDHQTEDVWMVRAAREFPMGYKFVPAFYEVRCTLINS
jgi:uncharacterized membrane protein